MLGLEAMQEVGVGGNSVWSSSPLFGEKLINMLEGVNWGRSPNRGRKVPENRERRPTLSGGGSSVSSSPEKFWKIMLESMRKSKAKIYIFP